MPLSPHVPDLAAMDMLLSVAWLGSLGRAAEEHGVTQPAVSSRISRMEHLLGLSLIERTAHGSGLTSAGSLVVDWAREVVDAASSFERGVDALRAQIHDRLRIVASMTIAEYLMPSWLVTAHHEEPDLNLALELANSSEVARRVETGLADLGYVEGPARPRGLRAEPVGRDHLMVVVSRQHPWARRRRALTARELSETPLIQRELGSGTRMTLSRELTKALGSSETVPPLMELTSTTAIKTAVQQGLAPAVISSIAVADAVEQGRLVAVPVSDMDLRRTLRVVWPSGRALLGPARTFAALSRRAHRRRTRTTR